MISSYMSMEYYMEQFKDLLNRHDSTFNLKLEALAFDYISLYFKCCAESDTKEEIIQNTINIINAVETLKEEHWRHSMNELNKRFGKRKDPSKELEKQEHTIIEFNDISELSNIFDDNDDKPEL